MGKPVVGEEAFVLLTECACLPRMGTTEENPTTHKLNLKSVQ